MTPPAPLPDESPRGDGLDPESARRYVDRACHDGLANDARDDVRLRHHQEVRGAFDLGDRGAGAVEGEAMQLRSDRVVPGPEDRPGRLRPPGSGGRGVVE